MTAQEVQERVAKDAAVMDAVFSVKYKAKPLFSIMEKGWFQKDYLFDIEINNIKIKMQFEFQIHYFNAVPSVVPAEISLLVSASTPNAADGCASTLFSCKGESSNSAKITYKPTRDILITLQNSDTFCKAIQKICEDIDSALDNGPLCYMLYKVNQ